MTKKRNNKYFFKKNRDGSITFKSLELLRKYNMQMVEENLGTYKELIYQEVVDDLKKQTDVIARDTLNRLWGFGKVRQDRFLNEFNFQVDCITEGFVTLEDIEKMNEGEME